MAWDFDNTDDYITIADAAVLTLPVDAFTFGGWIKNRDWAGRTNAAYLTSWGVYGANPSSNVIVFGGSHATHANRCQWRVRGVSVSNTSTEPGTETGWQHFLMTRTAASLYIMYRNNVDLGNFSSAGGLDVAGDWHIGRYSADNIDFYNGQMAEWFKINRFLSDRERAALVAGGSPLDLPGIYDATSWYLPMYGGAYVDVKDRLALTVNGSPVAARHPPVRMPFARRRTFVIPADVAGTTPIAASDTSALGLTATAHILGSFAASDAVSIRMLEAEQIAALVAGADSVAVALSAIMSAAVVLAPSDSVSLALSDAASILNRLDASDAVPISVSEAVSLLAMLTDSDSMGLDVAEAASLLVSLDQSDLIGLSLTEAVSAAILLFASVADSLGIGISEAAALAVAQAVAVADATELTLIEAMTVSAGVLAAESVGVTLSEVLDSGVSVDSADAIALDVTELLAIAGTVSVPDALALGLVDTATAAAVIELSDTLGITTAEAFSVLVALEIVEPLPINLSELEALVMVGVAPEGDPMTGFTLPAILVGGDDRHAVLVAG